MSKTSLRLRSTVVGALCAVASGAVAAQPATANPPIRHVFVIVLENKEFLETFGPGQLFAPYLTQTLAGEGALVPNYFGTGHASADNYIAMVSGQPPTNASKNDCPDPLTSVGSAGQYNVAQGDGCLYPPNFLTVADQLAASGLTWRAYAQDMPSACFTGHDAQGTYNGQTIGGDYARKHNGFMFFQSLQVSGQCANDVPLDPNLGSDLKNGPANVNFIFPDQCNDAHTDCTNSIPVPEIGSEADELSQADAFLKTWVPQITSTPAFKQDGLLAIVFDEGLTPLSCCGEPMTDPDGSSPGGEAGLPGGGGGQTGAVLISPFIKPGTISTSSYNHYSLLASIEDTFGLGRLGEANLPSTTTFGADVYTQP